MEELYKFITQTHRVTFFKDTCDLKYSPMSSENDNDFFRVPNYVNAHHTDGWFKERESTNEEDFEVNYGNPFCSLGHHRHSVFISKDEKKN